MTVVLLHPLEMGILAGPVAQCLHGFIAATIHRDPSPVQLRPGRATVIGD